MTLYEICLDVIIENNLDINNLPKILRDDVKNKRDFYNSIVRNFYAKYDNILCLKCKNVFGFPKIKIGNTCGVIEISSYCLLCINK